MYLLWRYGQKVIWVGCFDLEEAEEHSLPLRDTSVVEWGFTSQSIAKVMLRWASLDGGGIQRIQGKPPTYSLYLPTEKHGNRSHDPSGVQPLKALAKPMNERGLTLAHWATMGPQGNLFIYISKIIPKMSNEKILPWFCTRKHHNLCQTIEFWYQLGLRKRC